MRFNQRKLEFLKLFNSVKQLLSAREVADKLRLPIKNIHRLLNYYYHQGLIDRQRSKIGEDGIAKIFGYKISKKGEKKLKYFNKRTLSN